jgi:hypothetical protein
MKIFNAAIRYSIQAGVVVIIILSLPMKLINTFFEWRDQKQMTIRKTRME